MSELVAEFVASMMTTEHAVQVFDGAQAAALALCGAAGIMLLGRKRRS